MEQCIPFPETFIEALGGTVSGIGILLVCLSVMPWFRSHLIKTGAICIILSLALFSNHWTTYFAALFVVATVVTELEFLQTLAAIISKNKEYFSYKTSELSKQQQEDKAKEERKEILNDYKGMTGDKDRSVAAAPSSELLSIVNERALAVLENVVSYQIDKNVRVSSSEGSIELDGLTTSISKELHDRIYEVKYLPTSMSVERFIRNVSSYYHLASEYRQITKRKVLVSFVLVLPGPERLTPKQFGGLEAKVRKNDWLVGFSTHLLDEIGLSDNK